MSLSSVTPTPSSSGTDVLAGLCDQHGQPYPLPTYAVGMYAGLKSVRALWPVLAVAGCFLAFSGKLPFRLGRLPGDISYKGEHSSFYFPIVTCILLSLALTLIMWIVNYFRR